MIFISIFVENSLQYDARHNFSVLLRTGSIQQILIGFEALLEIFKIAPGRVEILFWQTRTERNVWKDLNKRLIDKEYTWIY